MQNELDLIVNSIYGKKQVLFRKDNVLLVRKVEVIVDHFSKVPNQLRGGIPNKLHRMIEVEYYYVITVGCVDDPGITDRANGSCKV